MAKFHHGGNFIVRSLAAVAIAVLRVHFFLVLHFCRWNDGGGSGEVVARARAFDLLLAC